MLRACEELVNDVKVLDHNIVKASPPFVFPDDSVARPLNKRWCPYCGKYTKRFKWNRYTRCEICWASNEDFLFKKANNTWEELDRKFAFRSLRKKKVVPQTNQQFNFEEKKRRRRERRIARKERKQKEMTNEL